MHIEEHNHCFVHFLASKHCLRRFFPSSMENGDGTRSKSQEIETAVNDTLGIIVEFPLDAHVRGISESEIIKVKAHYNWSMYQALLTATKRSLAYRAPVHGVRNPH